MSNESKYDFTETLADLDAGVFSQKVSGAVQKVALGVVENDKEGEVTITLKMKRIGESHQVKVEHSVKFTAPTRRGKVSEIDKTMTPLHVGRGGRLTIMPETQGDMFKAPKGVA